MRYQQKRQGGGLWKVVDTQTGRTVLADESYTVCSNVEADLNDVLFQPGTECGEVADAIRTAQGHAGHDV